MNNLYGRRLCVLTGISLCLLFLNACDNVQDTLISSNTTQEDDQVKVTTKYIYTYAQHVQNDGEEPFSFEYPTTFHDVNARSNDDFFRVGYSSREGELGASVYVHGERVGVSFNDYTDCYEYWYNFLRKQPDYQLLDYCDGYIEGLPYIADKTIYTVTDIVPESPRDVPYTLVKRSLYFNTDEWIFDISLISDEAVADKYEDVWEHLIESFKFIN